MPMSALELDEMKEQISLARTKDLNFAICLGKKAAGTVFSLHLKRKPEVLGRQAKQDGETKKVVFGTASTKGKELYLNCFVDPPKNLSRSMKAFLATQKLQMKIVVTDPQGNVIADGMEQDGAAPEMEATPPPPEVVETDIQAATEPEAITDAPPPPPEAVEAAQAPDDIPTPDTLAPVALKRPTIYRKSQTVWSKTRLKMQAEMRKLQDAIVAACGDEPDLQGYATAVDSLGSKLEVFDDRLDNIFSAIIAAKDEERQTKMIGDARKQIAKYQQALKDPFFQQVDDANGFVTVAVASTAATSLEAVDRIIR